MKIKSILKKFGEKSAERSVDPRTFPWAIYQPKPPAKIQMLISKEK